VRQTQNCTPNETNSRDRTFPDISEGSAKIASNSTGDICMSRDESPNSADGGVSLNGGSTEFGAPEF